MGAGRSIVRKIHTVWNLSRQQHEEALSDPVPEQISNAVALGVLTREMEAVMDVAERKIRYLWGENGRCWQEVCFASDNVKWSLDMWRLRIAKVGVYLMRCLPDFEQHPLLKLVPKRSYQLPRELLPAWYVQRFEHDLTQLDGTVLCKYHHSASVWFQLPHSGAAFSLEYSQLRQSADKILSLG